MSEEEKKKFLDQVVLNQGFECKNTSINDTPSYTQSIGDYSASLTHDAMIKDDDFEKLNIDWEHIRQVSEATDKKFRTPVEDRNISDSKIAKMAKIIDLMKDLMKDE